MTVINLTKVIRPERAEGIKRLLDGRTFMNFRVTVCPIGGEFAVNVETDYDGEEDVKDFLLMVLASEVK
jgi:hypothetical protein